ncbi:MAG TPA: DHHW family protein [Solirubrobacterales bacterium]|nr:DHHW family protein [Solirubrobacterales bacterium]
MIELADVSRSPAIDAHGRGNLAAAVDARGLTIHGWVFGSERTATDVEVVLGDEILVRMPIGIEREDVVEEFGELPGAARSGFMLSLRPLRAGRSRLLVRVAFDEDEPVELGTVEAIAEPEDGGGEDGPAWVYSHSPEGLGKVLVGRDGWLFLQGDSNDAIGQHTGRVRYSEADKEELRALFERRVSVAREAGATWLTAVVPDKEILYSEQLPASIVPLSRRPVHDYLEIAQEAGAEAVYLYEALAAAKDEGELYLRTDTHWNHRGAYVAYLAICRELGRLGIPLSVVEEDWIEWWERPALGDLGEKLAASPGSADVRATLTRSWARRTYDSEIRNHGRVMIHEKDEEKTPVCLVFGESFAETLLYFLKESFGRVVFAHTSMFIEEVVAAERPDVVLSLPIERFLIKVPDDEDALATLTATAAGKGGELPWSVAEQRWPSA